MKKLFCLHDYKETESGSEFCIKCGKYKPDPLWLKWFLFKINFSNWLWELRGLQTCPYHGFHKQSWWNGKCKKCLAEFGLARNVWTKTEEKKCQKETERYFY